MTHVRTNAHAKINWTLEVLGQRDDGYHDIRTVLQTIVLSDNLRFDSASDLSLSVHGAAGELRRAWRQAPETNLAYRAAQLLLQETGRPRGTSIQLNKRIAVAAGLGGGSSDAAATLRALSRLWQLKLSPAKIESLAAELGSDVPFFVHGGCALASGRGDKLKPLPSPSQHIFLATPKRPGIETKTARMYAALRPEHYSNGARTTRLAKRLRDGQPLRERDLYNVFENVLSEVDPEAAALFEQAAGLGLGKPHLCGSGPAFFFLTSNDAEQVSAFREQLSALPCESIASWTVSGAESTRVYDED
jgi:4-diphosphocytidyl-2-C-methyl-D-erythritol kinase